jgi:hypothetical protein
MNIPITAPADRSLTPGAYARAAVFLGVSEAAVRAVTHVEARGSGFDSAGRVLILNERHILYRRTSGEVRERLVAAGLAKRTRGGYPRTSDARYDWLRRAHEIAGDVAFEAISMGLPQIMGFNHAAAGYSSAKAMFYGMAASADDQLMAFAHFIASNKRLLSALRAKDWEDFAAAYNGPAYRENAYDRKMAAAYERFSAGRPADRPVDDDRLGPGDKGEDVAELQRDLVKLGYDIEIDGDYGPITADAVIRYQRRAGLTQTGIADHATIEAIDAAIAPAPVPADPKPVDIAKPDVKPTTGKPGPVIPKAPHGFNAVDGFLAAILAAFAGFLAFASGAVDYVKSFFN